MKTKLFSTWRRSPNSWNFAKNVSLRTMRTEKSWLPQSSTLYRLLVDLVPTSLTRPNSTFMKLIITRLVQFFQISKKPPILLKNERNALFAIIKKFKKEVFMIRFLKQIEPPPLLNLRFFRFRRASGLFKFQKTYRAMIFYRKSLNQYLNHFGEKSSTSPPAWRPIYWKLLILGKKAIFPISFKKLATFFEIRHAYRAMTFLWTSSFCCFNDYDAGRSTRLFSTCWIQKIVIFWMFIDQDLKFLWKKFQNFNL